MQSEAPAETPAESATEQLVAILRRPVPAAARRLAALHLVDWLGCALIGTTTATGRILALRPDRGGFLPASRYEADVTASAFALGGLGSIMEMDDVHRAALLHPGPVVIPAALAMPGAEDGAAFLDAVVIGYEAMVRLGAAVGLGHYAYFHNTATCGGFGAAAAAAHVAGLDDAAFVSALGNAASVSGGLWQCRHEKVMTKPFHCAEATRQGVHAALLAGRGLTGPRYILEGSQGFFAGLCSGASAEGVTAAPDSGWKIAEVSFKPWPACRHVHAAIDAALSFEVAPGTVERIAVTTYSDAIRFCDRTIPTTSDEAKFSLQHAVAVTLAKGRPQLDDFDVDRLRDPVVATLRDKVVLVEDAALTAAYPAHFGAAVSVTIGGRIMSRRVADAWGDSENPMQDGEVMAKGRDLIERAGASRQAAAGLVDAALALAEGGDLRRFRAAFDGVRTMAA